MMVQIFYDNTLIDNTFSVYECLDTVGCVKDITKYAYKDLYHCMYFVTDWEADLHDEQDEFFSDTKWKANDTTKTNIERSLVFLKTDPTDNGKK